VSVVAACLPLSALLSQVLVAFTIEFDNEFERQSPHRTTNCSSAAGSRSGPWLCSLVMWSNCMRFVGENGVSVGELERLARTPTNLGGIEKRWQDRFGKDEIDQLRESLGAMISRIDVELPDCLPILGYGLFSRGPAAGRSKENEAGAASRLSLLALWSRVLLAFAIEFERESELSLAIGANVVRVLDEKGVRVRDLPLMTGVSKEAISMALGFLRNRKMAVVEPDPAGSRAKVVRLTPKGREAQDAYHRLLGVIEARWQARFGKVAIRTLRESLERLTGEPSAKRSPLFQGLKPYPDGWRASVRAPDTLPHYLMVLHRGGFPDGS